MEESLSNEVLVTASPRFPENSVSAVLTLQGTCFTHSIDRSHVAASEAPVIDFNHSSPTEEVFFNPTVHKLRLFSQI